jgi:hypothetical protein
MHVSLKSFIYLIFKYIMETIVPDVDLTPNLSSNIAENASSFINFDLSVTTKVILCLVIMLVLHYGYKIIKNRFFSKAVSFGEDDEVLRDMEDIDTDDMEENSEYFDEKEQYEMEQSLKQELNAE